MKFKLTVVTVTYRRNQGELRLFINSFKRFNDLESQARLIIVDNSPDDYRDVEKLIREYNDIDYIYNPSNPGFGASNNIGFNKYVSDYVLFVNNDVEFTEVLFTNLINYFADKPKLGCIGIHQTGGAASYYANILAPSRCDMTVFNDKFHFISGAFMFFKSNVFNEIGRFDPNIFMYGEEFDISLRLREKGYYTEFLPNYSFWHKVGNRSKNFSAKRFNESTKSYCYILKKYNISSEIAYRKVRCLQVRFIYNLFLFRFNNCKHILQAISETKNIINENFRLI